MFKARLLVRWKYIIVGMIIVISLFVQRYNNKLTDRDISIVYVSQDEIIALEKERLRKLQLSGANKLFFGHVDETMNIIQEIIDNKNKSPNNVAIISKEKITGPNVKSISKEIYLEIIKRLQPQTDKNK